MAGLPIRQDYSLSDLRSREIREKDCRAALGLLVIAATENHNQAFRLSMLNAPRCHYVGYAPLSGGLDGGDSTRLFAIGEAPAPSE
jgi:hypothetical protein